LRCVAKVKVALSAEKTTALANKNTRHNAHILDITDFLTTAIFMSPLDYINHQKMIFGVNFVFLIFFVELILHK